MSVSEDTNCVQCNQKVVNYPNQFCRSQFLLPSQIDGVRKNEINNLNISENLFKINYESPKNELTDDKTSGNFKLDEFIKETQLNSKYCDDFIEWIPHSNLENVKYLTNGGSSKVYFGTWNLLLNTSLASIALKQISSNVALKAINDSENVNDHILNEVRKIK
jgi:hypothetical protein